MSYWNSALTASIVTIVVMVVAVMLSGFRLWKIFLSSLFAFTICFSVVLALGRKSANHGVNGVWGENGILPEILNWELWLVSLGGGLIASLILIYAVYSANSRSGRR